MKSEETQIVVKSFKGFKRVQRETLLKTGELDQLAVW